MATARRMYTYEYSAFNNVPEKQPERVKRTRQRPDFNVNKTEKRKKQEQAYQAVVLRTLIVAVIAAGILLVGIIVVNAQAAKLQYSINQLRAENNNIQAEIDMLNIRLDDNSTINQLETYATEELKMYYPQGSECIHLSSVKDYEGSLADLIREKAYE